MRVAKVTQQAEGTRRIRMTWPMGVVRRQCVPRVAAVVALAVLGFAAFKLRRGKNAHRMK